MGACERNKLLINIDPRLNRCNVLNVGNKTYLCEKFDNMSLETSWLCNLGGICICLCDLHSIAFLCLRIIEPLIEYLFIFNRSFMYYLGQLLGANNMYNIKEARNSSTKLKFIK